jgi:hypothetical protein
MNQEERYPPPGPPSVPDYQPLQKPARDPGGLMRFITGIIAGFGSGGAAIAIARSTSYSPIALLPPVAIFAILLFIGFRYHQTEYLGGFLLAPFIAGLAATIILFINCGFR